MLVQKLARKINIAPFGEIWHVDPRIEDILFFGRINSITKWERITAKDVRKISKFLSDIAVIQGCTIMRKIDQITQYNEHFEVMIFFEYLLCGDLSEDKDIPFGERWPAQSRSRRSGSQCVGPGLFQRKRLRR